MSFIELEKLNYKLEVSDDCGTERLTVGLLPIDTFDTDSMSAFSPNSSGTWFTAGRVLVAPSGAKETLTTRSVRSGTEATLSRLH